MIVTKNIDETTKAEYHVVKKDRYDQLMNAVKFLKERNPKKIQVTTVEESQSTTHIVKENERVILRITSEDYRDDSVYYYTEAA